MLRDEVNFLLVESFGEFLGEPVLESLEETEEGLENAVEVGGGPAEGEIVFVSPVMVMV